MNVGKAMFAVSPAFSNISRMRETFDQLQVQLATGERAQTLSDMGPGRGTSIDMRAQLAKSQSFQNNIAMVGVRLDILDMSITRFDQIEGEVRQMAASDSTGENQINLTTAQNYARSSLDEVINLLNTDLAGRYIFGGTDTDDAPVQSIGELLNGSGGRDGFRTVVSERKEADAGASGLGRLGLSQSGAVINLAEDGVHPFGFKLSGGSTDSLGVNISTPAGSPPSMDITFNSQPNAGEKIFVTLTLPDATTKTIELEATTNNTPGDGKFTIGGTLNDSATNFQNALQSTLAQQTQTELSAASVFAAAENFFNGNGETIQRVDGPPFDSATALVAATATNTVSWYDGSSNSDPRTSVSARVGESARVNYGVEGNETGFLQLVRSLASVAVETFSSTDPTSEARYDALSDRQLARLSENNNNTPGSFEVIAMELGVVRNAMGSYSSLNTNYQSQMETVLGNLENVSIEEVAIQLQTMQIRLQASYQTMSILNELTLVNYIR
ncbi:MAG: hypothetical protein L3J21_02215 [Devosiaceae bacterium]|nr:hypothetical protein [Devosiaceae bacterium]